MWSGAPNGFGAGPPGWVVLSEFWVRGTGVVYGVIRRVDTRTSDGALTEQDGECCASGRSCVVAYVRRVVVVRRQKEEKATQKSIIPSIHPSTQPSAGLWARQIPAVPRRYLRRHPATSQTTSYPYYALGPWTNNGLLLYRGGCGWCQSPPGCLRIHGNATIDRVPMDRVPRDPSFLIDLRLSTFCIAVFDVVFLVWRVVL